MRKVRGCFQETALCQRRGLGETENSREGSPGHLPGSTGSLGTHFLCFLILVQVVRDRIEKLQTRCRSPSIIGLQMLPGPIAFQTSGNKFLGSTFPAESPLCGSRQPSVRLRRGPRSHLSQGISSASAHRGYGAEGAEYPGQSPRGAATARSSQTQPWCPSTDSRKLLGPRTDANGSEVADPSSQG